MEYHEPAEWWQLYDLHDFESYCREFVIKGRFHSSVPREVVTEYKLAEYMMAHAYYYPPLYDEAYSKILRITEMAVRVRCKHLNIALTAVNRKSGKTEDIDFLKLINEIAKKEPSKNLKDLLHKLRTDRNAYMHSTIESDQGGLLRARIRRCVVMLNVLFMNEGYFVKAHEHKVTMMDMMESFKWGAFEMSLLGKNVLAEGMVLTAADHTGNGWVYSIHVATVPANVDNILSQEYPAWVSFSVRDLVIDADGISATLADIDKPISITRTNHPLAADHLKKYDAKRNEASEQYIKEAEFSLMMRLEIDLVKFGYEWGWQATDI